MRFLIIFFLGVFTFCAVSDSTVNTVIHLQRRKKVGESKKEIKKGFFRQ
jgi:hypothetical protein